MNHFLSHSGCGSVGLIAQDGNPGCRNGSGFPGPLESKTHRYKTGDMQSIMNRGMNPNLSNALDLEIQGDQQADVIASEGTELEKRL